MASSPYAAPNESLDVSLSPRFLGAESHRGFYRPSGQGDIFLFSPSLSSRNSNETASQSSTSFDNLSYSYSPTDFSAPKLYSPPALLPAAATSRSPLFVEAYLSGAEPKPITCFSPCTPFHELFNSSPAGYWQANELSVSPISRHSSAPAENSLADNGEEGDEHPLFGKIESLLEYQKTQGIPDSPPAPRPSSPSTLSSLSSIPSSPSALFCAMPAASSQTSHGPTPASSPGNNALSPLASPIKLYPKAPAISVPGTPSRPRYRKTSGMPRNTRRGLAAGILNQLDQRRGTYAEASRTSSPLKLPSSPIPAPSDSDDENYDPVSYSRRKTRKRARPSTRCTSAQHKKRRTGPGARAPTALTSASDSVPSSLSASTSATHEQDQEQDADPEQEVPSYPNRTFPLRVLINDNFLLFYKRFPVSSVIDEKLAAANKITVPRVSDAMSNPPRDALDLYTPRFVKGKGTSKVGLCPICHEPVRRGGEGKKVWLSMKFSAFNYHMQYAHGISATTGRPFSPPTAFRTVSRANPGKHEKTRLMEGKCHKCKKWVAVEGIKDVPTKVKEIFWWKHAAACHQGSVIDGECDAFIEDEVYMAVAGPGQGAGDVETDADEDEDEDEENEENQDSDQDAEGESVCEDEELD